MYNDPYKMQALASVAMIYYPEETKINATRKLKNYIKRNKSLYRELLLLGYDENTTEVSPRQQQVIAWYIARVDETVLNNELRNMKLPESLLISGKINHTDESE